MGYFLAMGAEVSGAKLVGLLRKDRRKIMFEKIKDLLRQEEGLTIVEYAVAAGLITVLVAAAFKNLGAAVLLVINAVAGFI